MGKLVLLCFLSLQHGGQGATEDGRQQSNRHGCGPFVANTTTVCQTTQTDDRRTSANYSARKINPYNTNLGVVLGFPAKLYHSGSSYSVINSARSALSSTMLLREPVIPRASHRLVSRFMKGFFINRPAFPRYKHI